MSGGLDATKPSRFSRRFKRDEIRAGWWGAQNGPTPCNPFIYPGGVSGRSERRGLCNAIADHDLSAKRMGGRPAGTITWRRASFRTLSPPLDVTYARKARRQGGWRRARLAARSRLSEETVQNYFTRPAQRNPFPPLELRDRAFDPSADAAIWRIVKKSAEDYQSAGILRNHSSSQSARPEPGNLCSLAQAAQAR